MEDLIFGYNQRAMKLYKVSLVEARLLYYLSKFFDSGNAKCIKVGTKNYYMIYYKKILDDNDALDIGREALRKILRKLEEKGFIEKHKEYINSSTMYIRVKDDRLKENIQYKLICGDDELLSTFIKSNWRIKKNYTSEIKIFGKRMIYKHTYIKNSVLMYLCGEFFLYKLRQNLSMVIQSKYCGIVKDLCIEVINNTIELSTQKDTDLYYFFVDNYESIERAICMAYIETLKEM